MQDFLPMREGAVLSSFSNVIPAQARTHASLRNTGRKVAWMPAFVPEARLRHDAGMTLTPMAQK